MKLKLLVMVLSASFLFSFSLVVASEDAEKGPFFQMDSNKDAVVSKEEFMTYHMELTEKRGKLFYKMKKQKTLTEENFMRIFLKQQEIRGENVFNRVDKDSDGTLTREEANIAWDRIVKSFVNGKGRGSSAQKD